MPNVLYVATVVKNHILEFHVPFLKMLKDKGYKTFVAAKNDFDDPAKCFIPHCDVFYNIPFERNPFSINNIKAYKQLKEVIDSNQFDIIHCHTPVGAMLTRLAARKARKKGSLVIYTAHGFHFFKGAPLINWLVYYPGEFILSYMTDIIITINKEDYGYAQRFHAKQVEFIPGIGMDFSRFFPKPEIHSAKRAELKLADTDFVILSVGELIKRKNHIVVLNALGLLKQKGQLNGIKYLICGDGKLRKELKEKVDRLGITDNVDFLLYRNDICEVCNASDLFVFMSLQEGLPVALMEAMACGVPVVCSRIRGNTDLIENHVNGEIVNNMPCDVANAIIKLKENPSLRQQYAANAIKSIKDYDLSCILSRTAEIYHLN